MRRILHGSRMLMMKAQWTVPAAAWLLLSTTVFARWQYPKPRPAPTWTGVSSASQTSMVGCQQDGVIVEVAVVEGQRVRKGEVLVRLDARAQQARVTRLRIAANADVRIREAEQRLALAEREEQRLRKLRTQDIASVAQLERAKLDRVIAEIAIDAAKIEQAVAQASLAEAEHRLELLTVRSPFDGTVAKLLHQVGDAVERLQPMAQVVVIDPLWVEFDCSLERVKLLPQGAMVMVQPAAKGARARRGIITYRAVLADAASQTRKVRVSVSNRDYAWVAGSKMRIWLDTPSVTPPRPK